MGMDRVRDLGPGHLVSPLGSTIPAGVILLELLKYFELLPPCVNAGNKYYTNKTTHKAALGK